MFDIKNNAYTDIIFYILFCYIILYVSLYYMHHTNFLKKQYNIFLINNSLEPIFQKNVTKSININDYYSMKNYITKII